MKLFAYHDTIATADDVRRKFAEMKRDQYPSEVYAYILQTHIDTENPCIDVIAWCCDIDHAATDSEYYNDIMRNATIIHDGDDGVWFIAY